MLTPQERETAYRQAHYFTEQCAAYRALLATYDLPLVVEMSPVDQLYRRRLFDQLLAADAGLQARQALARTREAQEQLRSQTVDHLDLRGHELLDEVRAAQSALHQAYNALPLPNEVRRPTLSVLAAGYDLDLGRLLDHYTMQWTGKEAALTYFEQLGQTLTQWRNVVRALNRDTGTLASTLDPLTYFFPAQLRPESPIVVDEHKLYQQLQYHPRLLDLLAELPTPATNQPGSAWPNEETPLDLAA